MNILGKSFILILCAVFVINVDVQNKVCPKVCQCDRNRWICGGHNITDVMLLEIATSGDPLTAEELLLKKNKLTMFPTSAFVNFTKLHTLDLGENMITKVPKDFSKYIPSLRKVMLNQNDLKVLESNDFVGYDFITEIDLYRINISELKPGVFKNLPRLEKLYVEANKLSKLPKGVLGDLKELIWLSFQGNQLTSIETQAFEGNTKLERLWLSNNQLKSLAPNLFQGLVNLFFLEIDANKFNNDGLPNGIFDGLALYELRMSNNNFTTLKSEWFGVTGKVGYDIKLETNPINCDCHAFYTVEDLRRRNNYDGNLLLYGGCAKPVSLSGKKMQDVFMKNEANCTSCSNNHCKNNATCEIVNKWNYTCSCSDPYYGEFCEKIDLCKPGPCQNNGTCTNLNGTDYNCTCQTGYEGKRCEMLNLCVSMPCLNQGICTNLNGKDYNCTCVNGFEGKNCENFDSCVSAPCLNNGNCTDLHGLKYNCTCVQGFIGHNCERAENEEGNESQMKPAYVALIILVILALITVLVVFLYLRRRKQTVKLPESQPLQQKAPVA